MMQFKHNQYQLVKLGVIKPAFIKLAFIALLTPFIISACGDSSSSNQASNKIDYLLMSPTLRTSLTNTGIERRGSYHPNTWTPFDTVTQSADEASDHHLVWADFSI